MDTERTTMNGFLHGSLCRVMANLLIWLMMFQGIPFQELSRSHQWDPRKFVETLQTMMSPLMPAEAHAAAPVADAGTDRTVFKNQPAGASISLDGQASFDSDGDPIVCEWYGPFNSAKGATPVVSVPEGTHAISLIVSDGVNRSEADSARVLVSPCFQITPRAKSGKVQLTWTQQAGAERYDIYRATESDPSNFQKIAETTSTYSTYLDSGVTNEISYLYTVGAVSQAGVCFSSVVSSHPTASRTPMNYRPVVYSRPVLHAIVGLPFTYDVQATDPNGTAVSYSLLTAPPGMIVEETTGLVTFEPAQTGSFEVTVQSSDPGGLTALQSFWIEVSEAAGDNKAPTANAGPDQTARVTQEAHLDGTASSDPEGNPLTYSWTFKTLPSWSTAQLSDDTSTTPSFTVDVPGVYEVELVVNDGTFNSPPDLVVINTENSKPVAEAGPDQKVLVGGTATLDGSSSSDVDGDSLTFQWTLTTKPSDSAALLSDPGAVDPTLGIDKAGTYSIELIVSDGSAFSDPDTVSLSTENRKPVANAGADQKVFVGDTATLDGTASSDVDGDSLTFKWSLLNAPAGSTAAISDAGASRPSFYVDKPGTYQLQLIVHDGSMDSDADHITVSTENRRPTADAGGDGSSFVGDAVTLDGSGSSDVDGDLLSFRWSFTTLPSGSAAVLSGTDQVKATFTIDEPGSYVAQLIVNDGNLDSAADSVTIATTNRKPAADAGPDQTVYVSDSVQLDGSRSTDPDGDVLTYSWSLTSKPAGSSAALSGPTLKGPTFTVDLPGTYVAQLIVNDGALDSPADTVVVSTENSKPVSNAGPDQQAHIGDTVTLDGGGSSDADGDALTFKWSFTSKPAGSSAALSDPTIRKPTFIIDRPGTYVAQLIVNDGTVDSAPDSVTINIVNTKPVANAGLDQVVLAGHTLSLSGSGSSDADGNALTYQWTLLSRPSGSAAALSSPTAVAPSFTADLAGDYVVQLIVNDGAENSDPDTVKITAIGNNPPTINSSPTTTATAGSPYSYQVTASDPEGNAITFSLVTAPTGMTINASTGLIQWLPGTSQAGNHSVTVAATDSWGASATQNFTIFVSDPTNVAPVVSAGPDQSITLPGTASLNGSVTDDGKPAGGILSILWSTVSGPSPVTFSDSTSPVTEVAFSQAGTYVLKLTANDGQAVSFDEITVTVNAQLIADLLRPAVTVEVSPASANVGTSVTITVEASDNVEVLSRSLTVNGAPVDLDPAGSATFTSPVAGVFTAVGTASDAAGNLGSSGQQFVFLAGGDTTQPIAAITSPADNAKHSVPTDIVGTASDANLIQYRLEYSVKDRNEFVTFAKGTNSVTNGVLGKLDPTTMRNGLYDVRLTVIDASGNTTSTAKIYELTGEMKVGNFTVAFNDLTVPMGGIPITVTRVYDSRMKSRGDFGIGWTLGMKNLEISVSGVLGSDWQQTKSGGFLPTYSLSEAKAHTITITYPDGKVDEFGVALNPKSQQLVPLQATSISFVPKTGTTSSLVPLDASPNDLWISPLTGIVDLLDLDTFMPFDPQRFQLTASDGTVYILNRQTGLESIKDTNGNTITFNQNGIIHSAGKSVLFARDAEGRITTITDPMGNTLQYAYDFYGDLISMTDQLGNTTRYTYNSVHGLVDIIDPRGIRGIRNEYDGEGRLVAHIDADGNRVEYSHDINARQEIVKDRLGNLTVYEYDANGYVLAKTDALGNRSAFTYDARGNKLSETDPLGHTSSFTYDTGNNMLTSTDALGNTTRYTYNAQGKVLTTTDPMGHVTTNTYDARGNVLTTTDPLGNVTSNTYDAAGHVLTTTDAMGNTTSYQYDAFGNRTRQTDPLGNVTTFTYDGNGNTLTETDPRGGVTQYAYDAAGRQISVQDPLGNITRTEYDAAGNRTATVDPLGNRTTFVYDAANRLIQTNYPDGTSVRNGYDAEGNRISATDQQNNITTYWYNANKQLLKVNYADGAVQSYGYDAAGRQTSMTDALGSTTTRTYDAAGRNLTTTDPDGNTTSFVYNANGNMVSQTNANGNTTTFDYDAAGRLVRTTLPGGQATVVVYDAMGRKTSETDAAGNTTQFAYDARGNLVSVTDALGGITRYEYDSNSNLTRINDANGHATNFSYDPANRLLSKTMPNGGTETYSYDAAGRQITKTDAKGQTIQYAYDALGRLMSRTYPDASSVWFAYKANGKRATTVDQRGTTSYDYDARNRLTQLTYPDGQSIGYTYDLTSRLHSISSLAGTISYIYNNGGRLQEVHDPLGNITTFDYDPAGNRTGLSYPNGTSSAYAYDINSRLTQLTHKNALSSVLASYTYTLGPIGNRTRIDENTGIVRQYSYDKLYRLTKEQVTDPTDTQTYANDYSYDQVGNRLNKTHTAFSQRVVSTDYTYNAADQLITENGITYTYDPNGNLSTKTDTTGTTTYIYDFDNRLVRVEKPSETVAYVYDADGNRVESVTSSGATRYLVDTNRGLAQVLAEYTPSGTLVASYVYADDLISMRRGNQTYYYHFDGLGSTRLLTDDTGAIIDTYAYDAFGNLITRTGATPNGFLFTGQQYDANVGLYYLRARYYQPSTGRFEELDPFGGDLYAPVSLHKYLYAAVDPVNRLDPSGQFYDFSGLMVSVSILQILCAMAPTFFKGAIIYAGIEIMWRPAFEARNEALNIMMSNTNDVILQKAFDIYQKANQLIALGASFIDVGVKVSDLGFSAIGLAKSLSNLLSATNVVASFGGYTSTASASASLYQSITNCGSSTEQLVAALSNQNNGDRNFWAKIRIPGGVWTTSLIHLMKLVGNILRQVRIPDSV